MDIVDSAIAKKYHEIRGARFFNETWEQFDTAATGKKLFLFGVGVGADYYYYKYGDRAKAEGIIDNNPFAFNDNPFLLSKSKYILLL